MSEAEHDATLAALREREQALVADIADARLELRVLEAQITELRTVMELVQRGGRRKPGPKSGTRLVVPPAAEEPVAESAGDAAA